MRGDVLDLSTSALLAVDLQTGLLEAIDNVFAVVGNAARLLQAADRLGVAIAFSEHYPNRIGPTLPALRQIAPSAERFTKTTFSAALDGGGPELFARWRAAGRESIALFGTETHVCVQQTAMSLAADGWRVHLVVDASGTRRAIDHDTAVARMTQAGVRPMTLEMAMFEWLRDGEHPEFRRVLDLVRFF